MGVAFRDFCWWVWSLRVVSVEYRWVTFREFCWQVWSLRDASVDYRWVWPLGSSVGGCGLLEL